MSALSTITREQFDALPQNEQIVTVCRDVLAAMDAKQIVANHGVYARWNNDEDAVPPFDVCDILDKSGPKTGVCHVCGKGAIVLAVARIRRLCDISFGDVLNDCGQGSRAWRRVFGYDLGNRIEGAFEAGGMRGYYSPGTRAKQRLRMIMARIVEMNGDLDWGK